MVQVERLEQLLEERNAHQAVVSNAPVRQNRFDTGEGIQFNLLGILAGVCRHECGNQHVTARLVDGTTLQTVSFPCQSIFQQEATVRIGRAHVLLLQAIGHDRNILQELIKDLTAVIVIGLKALERRSQRHMRLGVTTAIDNRRVVIHELNLVCTVVRAVTRQRDLQAGNGLKLNFSIEFLCSCIQCRRCLALVSHEPSTVQCSVNIGLTGETEGEVQTRRHVIITGRLAKDITNFRNELRNCERGGVLIAHIHAANTHHHTACVLGSLGEEVVPFLFLHLGNREFQVLGTQGGDFHIILVLDIVFNLEDLIVGRCCRHFDVLHAQLVVDDRS